MGIISFVCRYIFLALIVLISSCTSIIQTMPNTSIIDPTYKSTDSLKIEENSRNAKNLLTELSLLNADVAKEIGRLPDLHDGISFEEIQAIERLIKLNNLKPKNFSEYFEKINKLGKPEIRKYCASLQALFWLAEKNDVEGLERLLEFYNIETLLAKAWDFNDQRKWDNPQVVIDRLNSPQLFEYWFSHNFTYDWSKFWITTPTAYPQSAESSIKTKKGICFDAAYLAYKCLKQAGYDVTGLNVYFKTRTRRGGIMHSVCIIKKEDFNKITYYKLADTNSPGSISGPYESIKAIAEHVANRHGVSLGRYFTGVPRYDFSLF